MNVLVDFLAVFAGGGLGAALRYALSLLANGNMWATLSVNALGSFLIGFFGGFVHAPTARLFLMAGFCGGFTTFSTFAKENVLLLAEGNYALFALYTATSCALALGCAALGVYLSR